MRELVRGARIDSDRFDTSRFEVGAAAVGTAVEGDELGNRLQVVLFVGNSVIRAGLASMLRQLVIVRSVRECVTADEVGAVVAAGEADVVVVTTTENEFARDVMQADAGTKVLLLLDQVEIADSQMTGLYADGVLVQQELTPSALGETLKRIVDGEMPMPTYLQQQLLSRRGMSRHHGWPRPVALTSRESETLGLLAEGLSNKQLARRLSISDHGAKRLVTSVMLKLGVPNRTAAVVVGIRAGMISVEQVEQGWFSPAMKDGVMR